MGSLLRRSVCARGGRTLLTLTLLAALGALALPSAAFAAGYVYVGSWGSPGAQNGQFINPMFLCVDAYGYVYVSDKGNDRIEKFTKDGAFVRAWGTTGAADGQFNDPQGLCYDPADDLICVVDYDNHNVQEFTLQGVWVRTIGTADLTHPIGVCWNTAGDLVVTDSPNNHAVVFTLDGTNLGTLFDGSVIGPRGVVQNLDSGEYYVSDAGHHTVDMFDSTGAYDGAFGSLTVTGQVALDRSGNVLAVDWSSGVTVWNPDGSNPRDVTDNRAYADAPPLAGPWGVATAQDGSVYITDYSGARIARYVYDQLPPTVSSDYDGAWHDADFSVTLSATDDWAGVYGVYVTPGGWQFPPVSWWFGVDTVGHSTDGVWYYHYFAQDNVDNMTETRSLAVKIDTRPPITTVSGVPAGWVNHDVTLSFDALDRGAGVGFIGYQLNGGGWGGVPDNGKLTISTEGDDTLDFASQDNAVPTGNIEDPQTVHVLIDKTAPTVGLMSGNLSVARGRTTTFKYELSDNLSPTCTMKLVIKKGTKIVKTVALGVKSSPTMLSDTYSKSVKITLPVGKYTWTVAGTDLAGNTGVPGYSRKLTVK